MKTPIGAYAKTPHKTIEELCSEAAKRVSAGERSENVIQDIVDGYDLGWWSANHRAIEEACRKAMP